MREICDCWPPGEPVRSSDRDPLELLDRIADAVLTFTPELVITSWNGGAEDLYGWRAEEVVGQFVGDVLHSEFVTDSRPAMLATLRAGLRWSGDLIQRTRDGSRVRVHVAAAASGEATRIISINRDVTAQRAAEHASRRLAVLVETSQDAIVSTQLDGTIETWNAGAERLFGLSAAETIGRSMRRLGPADKIAEVESVYARVRAGNGVGTLDTVRLHRDGRLIDVSLTASPIPDETGKVIGISAIVRDIGERRALERQMIVTSRMASLGTLAAGVAHEINNPLAYVVANLEALPPTDELRDALEGCDRIRRIVRQLQTFSRADQDRRVPLDMRDVLDLAISMCFNELRHRATLVKDYAAVPAIEADESRLAQVFINLLLNAAQALPEGHADANEIRITCRRDGDRVVAEIRDTGSGIPDEIRGRIFDPFFTTRPVGVGTGLGLAMSHTIVTSHGGEIAFESEVGRGTTFRVALPVSQRRLPAPEVERPAAASTTRMRVLVIDDEPMITAAVARMFAAEHEVCCASDGREALERFLNGERFDAIVSDLMMPELTGMELYAELSRIAPDQAARMIFMTGGVFTPAGHAFLDRVPNERIEKPFDMKRLRALVRSLAQ